MNKSANDYVIRVLVVEDDGLVAAYTRSVLESIGCTVVGTALDGRQAVEMVLALKPAVVVMDIVMPHLDGITAAAGIQQVQPTPVVILTAHGGYHELDKAAAAGVGAFVVKPPRAEEMERAITIAMARHADLLESQRTNEELRRSLAEAKTLRGLLPICAGCKKIRDERGTWQTVETYISDRTEADFSHGYCPECGEKFFPGILSGATE